MQESVAYLQQGGGSSCLASFASAFAVFCGLSFISVEFSGFFSWAEKFRRDFRKEISLKILIFVLA